MSPFLVAAINKQVEYLRGRCALYRFVLKNQTEVHWDHTHQREPALAQTRRELAQADAALIGFIAEQRSLMPSDWMPDGHGRRCWCSFRGDLPIRVVTCDRRENHEGFHRESVTGTEWADAHEPTFANLGGAEKCRSRALWERHEGSGL